MLLLFDVPAMLVLVYRIEVELFGRLVASQDLDLTEELRLLCPHAVVPHQFSPFIAYAAFGWLPAGSKVLFGGTTRGSTYQVAGWGSLWRRPWYLLAYPAGGCQLTKARGLMCKAYYPFGPLALTSRAPDINGHRAYWATAYASQRPYRALAWQYAAGSWAVLELGR